MTWLLVALGAALGAPARYLTDRALARRFGAGPWGTLAVNVVGSFVLGLVVGWSRSRGLDARWTALLGTGFCGALTTYSTLSAEVLALAERRRPVAAALDLVGSVALGLLAAAAGWGLAAVAG